MYHLHILWLFPITSGPYTSSSPISISSLGVAVIQPPSAFEIHRLRKPQMHIYQEYAFRRTCVALTICRLSPFSTVLNGTKKAACRIWALFFPLAVLPRRIAESVVV